MDKLKMAHDYAKKFTEKINDPCKVKTKESMRIIAENAWNLADAMQAEADKRVNKERSHVLEDAWMKEVEKDTRFYGVGFVRFLNKDGFLSAERLDPKLVTLSLTEQEEWQPDWSQAPDWANWWALDLDMYTCYWYELKPSLQEKRWYFDYENNKVEGGSVRSSIIQLSRQLARQFEEAIMSLIEQSEGVVMNVKDFVKDWGIEVAKRTLDNAIGFGCSGIELFGGKYVFRTEDLKALIDAYDFVSAHKSIEVAKKYCDLHDPYGTSNHYNSLRAKIELVESCNA